MKTKFVIMTIGLSALALAGCESTTPNSNMSLKNVNSNTAVVVNSNANMPMTNTNMNRRDNSNISKDEYNKNRADYEKDKGSSTIGQGANDSWLWFKTRTALLTTNDLRESTINVDVVNDVVTLKGTVATKEQSAKAAQVAKDIEGVKSVTNQLKVAPNDSMTNTGGSSGSNTKSNANMKK